MAILPWLVTTVCMRKRGAVSRDRSVYSAAVVHILAAGNACAAVVAATIDRLQTAWQTAGRS